jgi:hypothetical protein
MICLMMTPFCLMNPGAFPEVIADVVLSSDDDNDVAHQTEHDAPADQDVPTTDDAGGMGTTLVDDATDDPVGAGAPGTIRPPAADWVLVVPPSSEHSKKCLRLAIKWSDPTPHTNQVMSQVELPPYRGPHSPLDLVALEIVFAHMFWAFHRVSQAKSVDAIPMPADDDKPLQKRQHRVPLVRKMQAPK